MDSQPTIVGGRYELGELLGRGGMAEVRKGTDTRLGRVVAVKRLRTDLASDATFQARFRREAQSSASLNHPAIVAVYDTGEEPSGDGPGGQNVAQPYIVMEYVAGRTLREILREGRKILPERALEITSGVLSALDYSHRAGIIHRDIKPGNVMLTPSGDVKVMDFGIARAISDASSTMTQTAAVVGTAQYLSPEQARGETVDSRSDVYSAGCLLYELLTGRPPFVGDSPVAVAYQHVREPAVPPSDHDTELPPEVDAIVMKALAKRLEDRYQSAAAMRTDIERYLAGRPVEATVPPPPVETPTAVVAATPPLPEPTRPPPPPDEDDDRRSRVGLWVLLGALVIALVAAAYFLWPKLFEEAPTQEQVPNVINSTEDEAREAIGDAGLSVGNIEHEASDTVKVNRVIEQSPSADDYVDPGTEDDLVISLGPPEKSVPSVINSSRSEAVSILRGEGFRWELIERESDEDKNQVIQQEPAAGTMVQEGSVVKVFYSDGPEEVPNVVGMTQEDATRAIEALKFRVEVVESDDTTEPAGIVFRQIPEEGETPDEGSTITIFVSTFVEPTDPTIPTDPTLPTLPTLSPGLNERIAGQRSGSA